MDKCEFGMTLVYTNVLDIEFQINSVESLINDLSTTTQGQRGWVMVQKLTIFPYVMH